VLLREETLSSVPRISAGLFRDVSAWDSHPLRILDFIELRVLPLIRREKTVPSHRSLQKRPPTGERGASMNLSDNGSTSRFAGFTSENAAL